MKKSAGNKTATSKPNIYEAVTARIIESLRAGVIPWSEPWQGNSKGTAFPSNYRTGAPYRGINVLLLWVSPYGSNYWLTFKQAQELGGTVRKAEKGTQIVSGRSSRRRQTKLNLRHLPRPTATQKIALASCAASIQFSTSSNAMASSLRPR